MIIVADQLRSDALGCFGNLLVRTPHIDAVADAGTIFTQAYVQHPVCSPSRASFLTGWYPHVRGHRTLTHLLRTDEPNLLRILKDSGYHVSWAGARGDTFAPGVTEQSVHEYGLAVPVAPWRSWGFPSELWARLYYVGRVEIDGADSDEATVRTAELRLASPPPEPWVLFLALHAPHCPFQVEEPWYSMYDRATVNDPLPPGTGQPRFKAAIRERHGLDRATPDMWREVIAVYYGMVSRLDVHVGRVTSALGRNGLTDHTVTMFFSDHGEYLGDFGIIEKWPSAMDQCITSTPLIIGGAGLPTRQRCQSVTELIDIVPTVLELAGIEASHPHFGRSLIPVVHDPARRNRRYAFTEGGFSISEEPQIENAPFPYDLKTALQHEEPELVGRTVAVRDERWTYVWRLYEPAELYDRRSDPAETTNLAGSLDCEEIEREMERALLRWQVETSDVIPMDVDPRWPSVDLPAPGQGLLRSPPGSQ